jgi:hypothetical protein
MSSRAQLLADLRAIRDERDTVLAGVARGDHTITAVLALTTTHRAVAGCYVSKIVEALPGVGKVRGRRMLADIGVAPRTQCADLSARHRDDILRALA